MICLDSSLQPLIERFNADRDKPRVVAIVSATCGACVAGAIAVNEAVVAAYPTADVSIFVVWIDILPSDDSAAAQRVAGIFNDPRVRQFHDPNRLVGDSFAKGLLEQPPAWDMYLLYAATPQQLWVDHRLIDRTATPSISWTQYAVNSVLKLKHQFAPNRYASILLKGAT